MLEADVAFDEQPEAAAAGLVEADRRAALVEPALQEDEARVEVVAEAGKLETLVEPDLLVREVDAAVRHILLEQRPEDAARDAADEVVAVEEDAAVDREVANPCGSAGVSRDGPARDPPRLGGDSRSRARSISIALARNDATTLKSDSSSWLKATARSLSTTSTPTSSPSAIAGTARRLSTPSSPGSGTSRPGPIPSSANDLRTLVEYLRIWRKLPTRIAAARAAAIPIVPSPTRTSDPTPSAVYPWLAIVKRRSPDSSRSRRSEYE